VADAKEVSLEDTIEKAVKELLSKKKFNESDKIKLDALNTAIKLLGVQKRAADGEGWGDLINDPKPQEG
jgi:hypothetical protein